MKARRVAGMLALLAAGCGSDAQSPLLSSVLPDRAAPGAAVDVVGDRLTGNSEAHLGGVAAEIVLREARRLRLIVPKVSPGLQLLVVTVDGRVSNALSFTVEGTLDAGP
jgi:hypothetical protein